MISSSPRWHRGSIFGDGFRHPLDRERRAQWAARVKLQRRAKRLTAEHADVAEYLPRFLGKDGRLDPTHQTLSDASGFCVNTVKEALKRLAACGLLTWARRIVREGSRVRQTSNSYMLTLGEPPAIPMVRCKATTRPEARKEDLVTALCPVFDIPAPDRQSAQAALARVAERRQAVLLAKEFG